MNLFAKLLNLLFPVHCVMCGDLSSDSTNYCGCELPLNSNFTCPLCRRKNKDCVCKKSFVSTGSPFLYKGNVKKAILLLKHTSDNQTLSFFSWHMNDYYNKYLEKYNIDIVVPVPMSKTQKKVRRFNHAEDLAKYFCKESSLTLRSDLLMRSDDSTAQHNLNRKDRFDNADNSYFFAKGKKINANETVLLIDDICTTGATLEACSRALLQNGASKVFCLTAAYTNKFS